MENDAQVSLDIRLLFIDDLDPQSGAVLYASRACKNIEFPGEQRIIDIPAGQAYLPQNEIEIPRCLEPGVDIGYTGAKAS